MLSHGAIDLYDLLKDLRPFSTYFILFTKDMPR